MKGLRLKASCQIGGIASPIKVGVPSNKPLTSLYKATTSSERNNR